METPIHEPIHCIIYISQAAGPFDDEVLMDILNTSRVRNKSLGITGILICNRGNILQVLEGDKDAVRFVFNNIEADNRHFNISKLVDRRASGRNFSDWSMAFRQGDDLLFNKVQAYNDPKSNTLLPLQLDEELEEDANQEADDSILFILKTFIAVNPELTQIGLH